jgi:60 kDa SS-A/Ro ribonucleoprotein
LEVSDLIRNYGPAVLKRADEPQEALAYYIAKNGSFLGNGGRYPHFARKGVILTNAMKKGIEEAVFLNFDHFTLSKYNRKNAPVKIRDTINLVHPNTLHRYAHYNGGSQYWNDIFKAILDNTLPAAETWEDTLMRWREKGFKSKKEAWESIIPKMGYMALLRNLRNLIESDVDSASFDNVVNKIKNPEEVKKSKQFPYRFFTAHKMLESTYFDNTKYQRKAQTALEYAMDASLDNLPRWPGRTAAVADFSGSMSNHHLSNNSVVTLDEVSALFMVMTSRLCEDADCYAFADTVQAVNIHERSGVLDNVQRILRDVDVGGSTNAYLVMKDFIDNNKQYDRCVFYSDLQAYNSRDKDRIARPEREEGGWARHYDQIAPLWNRYKRLVNPNAYLYSFNLASYGTSMFPITTHRLFLGGGFSDRILEFVQIFEGTGKNMIDRIKAVHPNDYTKKLGMKPIEKSIYKAHVETRPDDIDPQFTEEVGE